MATYGYKAITKAGKEVKGSLEADNKDLAMAELRRQELTVIDLGEQSFLTKDIDIQIPRPGISASCAASSSA